MAIIKTPAAGVSPYQAAAAAPTVLRAAADGTTVLANAAAATVSELAAANDNTLVVVNGQAALNNLITTNQSGVFEGANVTINLEEQNFNTTNQVTSTINYPAGNTGEIQYNSGANSFASDAYFTYVNSNVVTPGIRTNGYFYSNGAPFIGGGNAAIGNFVFTGDAMTISHANSTLSITGNGTGNVNVTAGVNVWTFDTGGNLTFPTGLIIDDEGANTRIYQSSGNLKVTANNTATLRLGWSEFIAANAGGNVAQIIMNGTSAGQPQNVVVRVGNSSSTTYSWYFGDNGNLTLPGNTSSINYANGSPYGSGSNYSNSNVSSFLAAFGSNVVSTTGNITAGYFVGNGSQLTGVVSGYGNANVVANLAALGSNPVSTTGNITAGILSATSSIQSSNITAGTLSAIGNLIANNAVITSIVSGANLQLSGTANVGALSTVGSVSANGNVTSLSAMYAGNGATWQTEASFPNILFLAADVGNQYVQAAIVETGGNASADWVSYANNGNTDSGWIDMGITGNTFNDPEYELTDPNDGYILVQGTNVSGTPIGGNLILATGATGLAHDIVFATGGFAQANIKARLYNSTGEFSVVGNIAANNIVINSIRSDDSSFVTIEDGVNVNGEISATGNITGGNIAAAEANVTDVIAYNVNTVNIFARDASGINLGANGYNNLVVLETDVLVQNVPLSVTGNITAGNLDANNLVINSIRSDDSTFVTIEDGVNVTSGFISAPGNIELTAGANAWTFDTTGNLTVPGSIILPSGALITGAAASPAPRLNGFDSVTAVDLSASGNVTATRVSTTGNVTANYFIGNGSQLTSVAVPSQTILPTIQTITATARPAGLFGGGQGGANVTVANTIPVTEYGVIITAGTVSETYKTGALGSIPGTVSLTFSTGLNSTQYTLYAYVTSNAGTYYSDAVTGTSGICLLAGTQIALSDGTHKAIEDITYTDKLLSWDFDRGCYAETTAMWIKRGETGSQYNLLTFSDGTTLRTFDQHRIFNKQAGAFTYPMTAATPVGTVTVNEHGQEITLTNKQVIKDTIEYYNVITDYHMNLFSDSVLTSCRFNNIYPIVDMKFAKDSRTLRTRAEFENVPDRFFHGLRLAEQTADIETVEWYVNRLLSTEVSTQAELAV